jgi:hypothetical protein
MKQTSYIVGYKDSREADIKYFGPFVSTSVADFFKASLPMPLEGGFCRTVTLQPFSAQDGHTVSQLVMRERRERQTA